jgi:hypothetical protein
MAAIISFIMGPIGRIVGMGAGALLLVGVLLGLYKLHNDSIRREALAVYNRTQLEQLLKDQREFIDKMNELSELQKKTMIDLEKQNAVLNIKLGEVDAYLSSQEARNANKPSSDVLKNTIRQLESVK